MMQISGVSQTLGSQKSQTKKNTSFSTVDGRKILYIPGGAGFLP